MIFVTVGTHHQPFTRLIEAAAELDDVVIQDDVMPPDEWQRCVDEAEVVVCHAGPATIDAVVAAGKIPIVVPRRRLWREHVDDHQLAFARRIADRVHVLLDPSRLAEAIARHDDVVKGLADPWRSTSPERWLRHFLEPEMCPRTPTLR